MAQPTLSSRKRPAWSDISIHRSDKGKISCELKAPQVLSLGEELPVGMVADAISLSRSDIVTDTHPPMLASVGLPFVMVELRDQSALQKAKINASGFEQIAALGIMPDIHLYVRSQDEFDIRARMFAPHDGVPEDPATGSANCALAGLLGHFHPATIRLCSNGESPRASKWVVPASCTLVQKNGMAKFFPPGLVEAA